MRSISFIHPVSASGEFSLYPIDQRCVLYTISWMPNTHLSFLIHPGHVDDRRGVLADGAALPSLSSFTSLLSLPSLSSLSSLHILSFLPRALDREEPMEEQEEAQRPTVTPHGGAYVPAAQLVELLLHGSVLLLLLLLLNSLKTILSSHWMSARPPGPLHDGRCWPLRSRQSTKRLLPRRRCQAPASGSETPQWSLHSADRELPVTALHTTPATLGLTELGARWHRLVFWHQSPNLPSGL